MDKEIFTAKEAALYSGYKLSYIRKLCHLRAIPFSKPRGGKVFFERSALDNFLTQNKITPHSDLEKIASTHVLSTQ